jgi:hypothetical protein
MNPFEKKWSRISLTRSIKRVFLGPMLLCCIGIIAGEKLKRSS